MNKTAIAFLVTSLFVGTAHAAVELVTNGGFEAGNFSSWTQSGDTDPTYTFVDPFFANSGNYGAGLGPYNGAVGTLSQSLGTVAGHEYTVQFDLANFDEKNANNFTSSFGGKILAGGATPSLPISNGSSFDWTHYSFDVIAHSASTELSFTFSSKQAYFGLDNVSVVAVPEPDEYIMMLLGAGLVAFQVRQKKSRLASSSRGL
jgi:hypothetical protein